MKTLSGQKKKRDKIKIIIIKKKDRIKIKNLIG
jgi:hypothetical protein